MLISWLLRQFLNHTDFKKYCILGFRGGRVIKIPSAIRRPRFDPWVGKIPWRKKWQSTPVFLSGESHGQRSLAKSLESQRVGHD